MLNQSARISVWEMGARGNSKRIATAPTLTKLRADPKFNVLTKNARKPRSTGHYIYIIVDGKVRCGWIGGGQVRISGDARSTIRDIIHNRTLSR